MPMSLPVSTPFGRGNYRFVDLYDMSRSINLDRMCVHPINTQIAMHIKPVGGSVLHINMNPLVQYHLAYVYERPRECHLETEMQEVNGYRLLIK